jgi:hypothetical protein
MIVEYSENVYRADVCRHHGEGFVREIHGGFAVSAGFGRS